MSQPAAEGRVPSFHLWWHDRRTLCDLRNAAQTVTVAEGDRETTPICGACVLAVEALGGMLRNLLSGHPQPHYYPSDAKEAVTMLRGTRWSCNNDLDGWVEWMDEVGYTYPMPPEKEDGES